MEGLKYPMNEHNFNLPIRVLHFPDSLDIGNGRMSVIMNIYRNIDRNKVQFDFIATVLSNNNYINEIKSLGGKVYLVPTDISKNLFKLHNYIKNVLSSNSYGIVHYHATSPWGIGINIAKRLEIPNRIVHSHNSNFSFKKWKAIRNEIFTIPIINNATKFIACSPEAGKGLFKQRSFTVLNNAIDVDKFKFRESYRNKTRKVLQMDDHTMLIGQIGRLVPEKNPEYSIKIVKYLSTQIKNFRFVFIGTGPMEEKLQQEVKRLNIEKYILFLGHKSNINEYYSMLDVLILPSYFEGLPMVSVEAQCAGLPIILSDSITRSSDCGLATFKSIHSSPSAWGKEILRCFEKGINRQEGLILTRRHGFDANVEAKKWESMYLKMQR
ncbi:glycosyltransferase [Loigolactobacillus coryniformis]